MSLFDGNLKQRLIGTVVLIILAVVFLPMIFNNKGEKLPETIVTVPLEPERPEVTNTSPSTPTPDTTQTAATTVPIPQPDQTTPAVETANTPTATPPATQPVAPVTNTVSNTPVTAPSPAKNTTSSITPSWTIQVAAVSNAANAESFTNRLRKANYNAYIRKEGNLHRVFVGPFIKKSEATQVQKLIEKQFKEKGIVREFKPESQ